MEKKFEMIRDEKAKTLVKQIVDALIVKLANNCAPWQKQWDQNFKNYNPFTGTVYHGLNQLWLDAQRFNDPRWCTFKQAQFHGVKIKKGEHATTIMHVTFGKTEKKKIKIDKNGYPVKIGGKYIEARFGEEFKEIDVFIPYRTPYISYYNLFNAEQCENFPNIQKKIELIPAEEKNELAERIIKNSGAKIIYGPDPAYSPSRDMIFIPEKERFTQIEYYYSTLLHELGHWTGHKTRLDRLKDDDFGSAGYAIEELRAEITSMAVCSELQLKHDTENHASYVKSWIKVLGDNPLVILEVMSDVNKMFSYIMKFKEDQEKVA